MNPRPWCFHRHNCIQKGLEHKVHNRSRDRLKQAHKQVQGLGLVQGPGLAKGQVQGLRLVQGQGLAKGHVQGLGLDQAPGLVMGQEQGLGLVQELQLEQEPVLELAQVPGLGKGPVQEPGLAQGLRLAKGLQGLKSAWEKEPSHIGSVYH